jgi:hypothetical protein
LTLAMLAQAKTEAAERAHAKAQPPAPPTKPKIERATLRPVKPAKRP